MWWAVRLSLVFVCSAQAWAQQTSDLAFSRNARTFETIHSSLVGKSLAHACLGIFLPDGIPCNPAQVPDVEKPTLGAQVLISNGYSALEKVRTLLNKDITQKTVDTLFGPDRVIQIEANADLAFRSKYLVGQYTPATVKAFSVARNEANPDVELYAIQESGFTFQTGYNVFKPLNVGLQFRSLQRRFIRQRFRLTELATDEGKALLKPKDQTAVYFEPGLIYRLPMIWDARVSLMVANLGYVSKAYDELYLPVELQGGLTVSPPVYWGHLDLSVEMRSMNYEEAYFERLRLGALYQYGAMYLAGGLDANGISGGVYYQLERVNAGILYSTTQLVNSGDDYYTQTVYVQLGWQI